MKTLFEKIFLKIFRNKKAPDLIIVGTQKGGTTTLFNILNTQKEFNGSIEKEVHFFDVNYKKGEKWYLQNFMPKIANKHNFESSPSYLFFPFVPQRIHNFNKDIKIIIILRDPIERAFSAWNMYKKLYNNNYPLKNSGIHNEWERLFTLYPNFPTFEEIIDFELKIKDKSALIPSILKRGEYFSQIERYFKLFDKKNILILESIDLKMNSAMVTNKILSFMHIERQVKKIEIKNSNVGNYKSKMKQETYTFLKEYYKKPNNDLQKLLGQKLSWM